MSEEYDGTQPLPAVNKRAIIHRLVEQDLEDRLAFGLGKYGAPLQAFNGRDALQDAYDELLDLACYIRQVIEESRNPVDGKFTLTCATCQGEGFVAPRQSMVSYVPNQPSVCPTCSGNGWLYAEVSDE